MNMTEPAEVGDRVCILWTDKNRREQEKVGYLLASAPDLVKIADSPADDGRDDPKGDWWRDVFVARHVHVIRLKKRIVNAYA